MERLTDKRLYGKHFYMPKSKEERHELVMMQKPTEREVLERLCEIEEILGDSYDLNQLKTLMDAIKNDGKYIIWEPAEGITSIRHIKGVSYSNGMVRYELKDFEPVTNHHAIKRILTREEAESAIKRKKGAT